ncbi:hypothetical protein CHARACLAT_032315 [Characodon lateralis]|uniref:Uncharacterized protein n=1 Tax=Characodon lateralis TaxID=208331 RepID=A0ABU7E5B4_9TELE|nr:hypothetical protein [Characodon lateralis]
MAVWNGLRNLIVYRNPFPHREQNPCLTDYVNNFRTGVSRGDDYTEGGSGERKIQSSMRERQQQHRSRSPEQKFAEKSEEHEPHFKAEQRH